MKRAARIVCMVGLIIAATLWGLAPAEARSEVGTSAPQPLPGKPESVDAFMAGLSDEAARAILRRKLESEAAAGTTAVKQDGVRKDPWIRIENQVISGAEAFFRGFSHLGDDLEASLAAVRTNLGRTQVIGGLGCLAFAVLAGLGLERWLRRKTTRGLACRSAGDSPGSGRGRALLQAGFIDLTAALGFALAILLGYGVALWLFRPLPPAGSELVQAIIFWRAIALAGNILLRPRASFLRLSPMSDTAARTLHACVTGMAGFLLAWRFVLRVLWRNGLPQTGLAAMLAITACALFPVVLAFLVARRRELADWLCRPDAAPWQRFIAPIWHLLAAIYILLLLAVWMLLLLTHGPEGAQGFVLGGLLAIPAFILLDRLIATFLAGLADMFRMPAAVEARLPMDEDALLEREPGNAEEVAAAPATQDIPKPPAGEEEPEGGVFRRSAQAILRLALAIFLGLALLQLWDVSVPLGETAVRASIRIIAIMAAAVLLWGLVTRMIESRLGGEREGPNLRLRTLLPLLRKTIGVFLLITTAMIVIAQMGVDIGPLLAGAGVFGLALGMGMQTLVRDIVAGVFFLMDDAFRVGDFVQLGTTEGFVSRLSLRAITLIHGQGYVQVMSYGNIKSVINFTRGPIIVKLKFPMPLNTNPKDFKKIIKRVNADIMADEELRDCLVQPVKSQGVRKVQDSVLEFGVKFTAKPGTQFAVKREVFNLLLKHFRKMGFQFAVPSVSVIGGSGLEGGAAGALAKDGRK